jgi:hypothetical protein
LDAEQFIVVPDDVVPDQMVQPVHNGHSLNP